MLDTSVIYRTDCFHPKMLDKLYPINSPERSCQQAQATVAFDVCCKNTDTNATYTFVVKHLETLGSKSALGFLNSSFGIGVDDGDYAQGFTTSANSIKK